MNPHIRCKEILVAKYAEVRVPRCTEKQTTQTHARIHIHTPLLQTLTNTYHTHILQTHSHRHITNTHTHITNTHTHTYIYLFILNIHIILAFIPYTYAKTLIDVRKLVIYSIFYPNSIVLIHNSVPCLLFLRYL